MPTTISCPKCTFEGNALEAIECELCKHPLKDAVQGGTRLNKLPRIRPTKLLPVFLVLAAGAGVYFLHRNSVTSRTTADSLVHSGRSRFAGSANASGFAPLALSQPAPQLNPTSSIQLYDAMRDVPNVPDGLFNYSSAQQFAALVAHGVNTAIAQSPVTRN